MYLRVGDERASDREAPLHPSRVLSRRLVAELDEVDGLDERGHLLGDGGRRDAREAGEEAEVLLRGELRPEDVVLRADAHHGLHRAQLLLDGLAEDEAVAARGLEDAGEHVEGGGLAGAVVAEQAEERVARDAEVDVEDGRDVPVRQGQVDAVGAREGGRDEGWRPRRVDVGETAGRDAHLCCFGARHAPLRANDFLRLTTLIASGPLGLVASASEPSTRCISALTSSSMVSSCASSSVEVSVATTASVGHQYDGSRKYHGGCTRP